MPLQLLLYALYRMIRAIVLLESDLFTLVRKLSQQQQVGDVEFFNVITRYRLDATDIAQEYDFLLFNDGFGTMQELKDVSWMIYTITDRYVYFVRIPSDTLLSINHATRLTPLLHTCCDRVARMDINIFVDEVRATIPPMKGRVVMLHSSPCCGGSMLARMLSSTDPEQQRLIVHGEPPVLSALAVLVNTVSIETIRSITYAALRFAVQHIERDQVLVMKTRTMQKYCCLWNFGILTSSQRDGRVVKALDLSSNGRKSSWVRTPLALKFCKWSVQLIPCRTMQKYCCLWNFGILTSSQRDDRVVKALDLSSNGSNPMQDYAEILLSVEFRDS
ncbi:hypothetical protein Y032_0220g2495, partial [Ancylostoma ceylanicum]